MTACSLSGHSARIPVANLHSQGLCLVMCEQQHLHHEGLGMTQCRGSCLPAVLVQLEMEAGRARRKGPSSRHQATRLTACGTVPLLQVWFLGSAHRVRRECTRSWCAASPSTLTPSREQSAMACHTAARKKASPRNSGSGAIKPPRAAPVLLAGIATSSRTRSKVPGAVREMKAVPSSACVVNRPCAPAPKYVAPNASMSA